MNPCYGCCIEDTQYFLEECCWRHPETKETSKLELDDGNIIYACPNLGSDGTCQVYDKRPEVCKDYFCPKFSELDLVELLTE